MILKNVKTGCLDYKGKTGAITPNVCPLIEPSMVFQTSERRREDPAYVRIIRVGASGEQSQFDIDMEDLAKKETTTQALYRNLVVFDAIYSAGVYKTVRFPEVLQYGTAQ